ncbi:MAG: ATP-NAD kinase family protein [Firmicutes bacterium]|nr:ATP-NAD kinase family protein [Bacillota bacterium]
MKLGLIINPIAGMGGRVGLKGTDGAETLQKALSLGAVPEANSKARRALHELLPLRPQLEVYTYPGAMGEDLAKELGFQTTVLGEIGAQTTPEDTLAAAKEMLDADVDLLCFAGGDGTARNIAQVIQTAIPVLGIPAGVKIHSGVFASHPQAAGQLMLKFFSGAELELVDGEVMDIDEEAFRGGVVTARLYGLMKIPLDPELIQMTKSGGNQAPEREILLGIAERIVEDMEDNPGTFYIIGSGSSLSPIMEVLDLPNTLLGIDVVRDEKLVATDVNEQELLDLIRDKPAKIVVTVIGNQGYVFGRGNQQISAEVIKQVGKENILIVATRNKLDTLQGRPLLVDTGDPEVNALFHGFVRVITTYSSEAVTKIKGLA